MDSYVMKIQDQRLLKDLKTEFQGFFPYLKLEFFRAGHQHGEGSPAKELLSDAITVAAAREGSKQGDLTITPATTVEALEDQFDEEFGLHVQVFRRSGKIWLETSVTDKWTLDRQNLHGHESTAILE